MALATSLAVTLGACDDDSPTQPTLSATCGAAPAAGAAPLAVVFTLGVSGASRFDVTIAFGDGSSSTGSSGNLNLAHTYLNPGSYTASFTVSSGGQSAACATGVTASGSPAPTPTPPPFPGGNQPPVAVFKTTPDPAAGNLISGPAPLSVLFNMCATQDVDLDVLLWTMDFEGDRRIDVRGSTGAHCRRTFAYPAGTYRPEICVTDVDARGEPRHDFQCRRYTVQATP